VSFEVISKAELRNDLTAVLARVAEGRRFAVCVNNRVVAHLVPGSGAPPTASREQFEAAVGGTLSAEGAASLLADIKELQRTD
jgi:antitoxin (DNA-binding transcriptional repressor) of toxin-antitoxin stability system